MTDTLATAEILRRLQLERDALLARLDKIPADLQNKQPAPGRWSIAEVLEHLTRLESGVTKLLMLRGQAPPPADTPPGDASYVLTSRIRDLVRDRTKRVEAPERVQPAGTTSAQDALDHLKTAREALLAAFASANTDALDKLTHLHPIFGPLTLRSWVALTADHEARHSDQIQEIAQQLTDV